MVATAEIKINLVPRQTLSGLGCLCSNLQVQGSLNVLILIGSFWSWKHFVSRNCPFQRHCRQSALSQPGILCFPVPRDGSARCGRYCAIPFTGGRSHNSRFVPGVLLPALILPAPLLGIHLGSGQVWLHSPLYDSLSISLLFVLCCFFQDPFHDKLPNFFDSKACIRHCLYLFTCITSPHLCLHRCYHHSDYEYNFTSLNAHVPVHPRQLVSFPETRHLHIAIYLLVCLNTVVLAKALF